MTASTAPRGRHRPRISLEYTHTLADAIGARHGLTAHAWQQAVRAAAPALAHFATDRKAGAMPFHTLPYVQDDVVRQITRTVRAARRFDDLLVIGIGGSALGNRMLQAALNHPEWNLLSKAKRRGRPRLHVLDNVDPERLAALLDVLNLKKTLVNVITKSGDTAETMSNFMVVRQRLLRAVGHDRLDRHIIATTDATRGNLRALVEAEGYTAFDVPDGVGGRYSVLTPVGLVSAAFCGINIAHLLAGAAAMEQRCRTKIVAKNPAAVHALLHYRFDVDKGKRLCVLMPYSHRLRLVADWFAQLWGESLGKKHDAAGEKIVHVGPTPIGALGVTDQHSQLQLYTEGPNDKVITLLAVDRPARDLRIPRGFARYEGLAYLSGHTQGELFAAEYQGTLRALVENQRPVLTLRVPEISAYTLGQLIMFYEISTALAGYLYGVNPFDQPGVELGKRYAYAQLGRPGFEAERRRLARPGNTPAVV